MPKTITPKNTWDWLYPNEQEFFLAFSPDAESIINGFDQQVICEEKFFPYTPVGCQQHKQGNGMPWLPNPNIITKEETSRYTTIHHPSAPDYTKTESRNGLLALVRRDYVPEFKHMTLMVMPVDIRAMNWEIYQTNTQKPAHIYLTCNIPGPNESCSVALYVPVSYFKSRNFDEVKELHNKMAVGYYNGKGFRVDESTLEEWRGMEAAALTCAEAKALRKAVENFPVV